MFSVPYIAEWWILSTYDSSYSVMIKFQLINTLWKVFRKLLKALYVKNFLNVLMYYFDVFVKSWSPTGQLCWNATYTFIWLYVQCTYCRYKSTIIKLFTLEWCLLINYATNNILIASIMVLLFSKRKQITNKNKKRKKKNLQKTYKR